MLRGIVLAFMCFILFLLLHVGIFHWFKLDKRFRMLAITFWGLSPVYLALFFLIPEDVFLPLEGFSSFSKIIALVNGLLIYTFLWFGYCQFYFVVDRAISVRIMIELDNAPGKKLAREQITQVYDLDDMLSRRLRMMVNQKYVTLDSGYYKNTPKGYCEALVFKFLKEFLQLGKGG